MEKEINPRTFDEYISTDFEASLMLAREISHLTFLERMEPLMTAVGKRLEVAGADFSNVRIEEL